jgi:hypothetical protein
MTRMPKPGTIASMTSAGAAFSVAGLSALIVRSVRRLRILSSSVATPWQHFWCNSGVAIATERYASQ